MLSKGGFTLRKWSSNHQALVEHLPPEEVERRLLISFGNEDVIKALGLLWNSTTDKLIFYVQITQDITPTKISVLRTIASIYDPLGILSPVIIQCQIFIQQLWQIKINCDDQLTTELKEHWQSLQHNLPIFNSIHIGDQQGKVKTALFQIEGGSSQKTVAAKARTVCSRVVSRHIPSFIESLEDKFKQDKILD